MNARFGAELPRHLRQSLDCWLHLWDVPHLEAKSRIEWSQHLTRGLGRCYPDKLLIRISSHLESHPKPDLPRENSRRGPRGDVRTDTDRDS